MTALFPIRLSLDRFKNHHKFCFSAWRVVAEFFTSSLSCSQPCLYPRTVTHRHWLFLHAPTPCLCRSFLPVPTSGLCNSWEGTGIHIHSTCPIHVYLLLLTSSLIVSMLALLCTSSSESCISRPTDFLRPTQILGGNVCT